MTNRENRELAIRELRYGLMRLCRLGGWILYPIGLVVAAFGGALALIAPEFFLPLLPVGLILLAAGCGIIVIAATAIVPYQYDTEAPEAKRVCCTRCGGQPVSSSMVFPFCVKCGLSYCPPWQSILGRAISKFTTLIQVLAILTLAVFVLA
jgi:hypothetical protein